MQSSTVRRTTNVPEDAKISLLAKGRDQWFGLTDLVPDYEVRTPQAPKVCIFSVLTSVFACSTSVAGE